MDLNHLLYRHQAALLHRADSGCSTRRAALARSAADLASAITLRQRQLGATFPLMGAAR